MDIKRILLSILLIMASLVLVSNFLYYRNTKAALSQVEGNTQEKICYLTFDDGPSANTEKVLDILKEYDVKATFFLIGSEVDEEDRAILERMQKEGHAIGLHSNVHSFDKIYVSAHECVEDYVSEYEKLKNDFGIDTKLFRFPGGSVCRYMNGEREDYVRMMREKGFLCYDWHVSGEDSVGNPTVYSIQKSVADKVFKYEHPIVLLHDSRAADATVEALPGIIESIKAEGYAFENLQEREEYIFRWKTEK